MTPNERRHALTLAAIVLAGIAWLAMMALLGYLAH